MKIDILTIFPNMINSFLSESIVGIAVKRGILEANVVNIRDFSTNIHKKVDDYPYGGGGGMVMQAEPIYNALKSLNTFKKAKLIYFTPQGKPLSQKIVENFLKLDQMILLCGHYKGIDNRIRDLFVTDEISIGDYVLSGGELAAMVFIDSIMRLKENVIGNINSAKTDSFQNDLLGYPLYTRPRNFLGKSVPKILLSGDHAKIKEYRLKESILLTKKRRKDLLKK